MISAVKDLQAFHYDHRLWANELAFYADELRIYEHRLEELVQKYQSAEVLSGLEQFQNQFIRQKEVLDALKHDIHIHEQKLGEAIEKGEDLPLDPEYHGFLKEQMDTFRSIYASLKVDFFRFLAKWI
ncbi:MAG: hypothetical protein KDC66_15905 [Phaeodactylibacter sp.]|nr:hypothetical protein [Phaeodactylibacter sp.]MCB9273202.1 hypothetical protein [Lewinellaceae bacterium]